MTVFDREKISHMRNTSGFALVNGCQGIFVDDIYPSYQQAHEEWLRRGGFENGEDEQIVEVIISVVPDTGRFDDICDRFERTEKHDRTRAKLIKAGGPRFRDREPQI